MTEPITKNVVLKDPKTGTILYPEVNVDIPTVNDTEIEIQKNSTKVGSFTTNQSGSKKTINITVPTKTSDLTNDSSFLTESDLSGYAKTTDLPTVNNATIKIQKNGTDVDSFTANQATAKTINITVPTSAADVSALPSSTKYGASLDLSVNTTTYVVTATLKDQDGTALSTDTIDLPLESVVVSGAYNSSTKKVELTLQSGSVIDFSVADLVSGLQSEITSSNKLSADLIADGTTNKVVTASEKTTWNGKQNSISDLEDIRSNASAGADAATTISGYGDVVSHDADEFASADHTHTPASIGAAASTHTHGKADITDFPTIPTVNDTEIEIQKNSTKVGSFTLNQSGSKKTINITVPTTASDVGAAASSHTHTKSEITDFPTIPTITDTYSATSSNGMSGKAVASAISGKQDTISDLSTIRTNSEAGAAAATAISGYGDIVTHDANEFASADHSHSEYLTSVSWSDVTGKPSTFTPASHNQASSTINALTDYSKSVSGGTGALSTSDTLNKALAKLENALDGKQASGSYAAASHSHVGTEVTLTGYEKASSASAVAATDTVNAAIGKIEKALDGKQASGNYVPTSRKVNNKALSADITLSASDVGAAASSHDHVGSEVTLTGYEKASSASAVAATDTVNEALGKIEKALDGKQVSGSYADASHTHTKSEITDFPTIPTVNNKTITIQKNGTTVDTFTLNQSSNKTINITVPTQASDISAAAASHTHGKADITDFPTIPTVTDTYSGTSSDAMSGKAVKQAIDGVLTATFTPGGSVAFSSLPTLSASVLGKVYNVTDAFTTTSDFVEGAGKNLPAGTNVAVVNTGTTASPVYKFDAGSGYVDLSGYVPTSRTVNSKALSDNITLAGSDLKVTGYSKAGSASAIAATDTINAALGKLEKALDGKQASGSYAAASHSHDTFVKSGTGAAAGFVPAPSTTAGSTKYLCENGEWGTPAGTYVHPTTSGNKHIPSGGSSGQILKYSADGTATWANEYSYTHPTSAGNKHVPSGGSSNQVLVYGGSSGTAAWGSVPSHTHSDYLTSSSTLDASKLSGTIPSGCYTNTTYSNFVKSGTGAAAGLVPAPSTTAGTSKYLCEDGTWATPAGTYVHPTTAGNKHIPAGGSSGQILKYSAAGTATWANEYSYTHPSTSGNKHIPSGGSSGQFLKWSADGTATWSSDNDTKNTAGTTNKTGTKMYIAAATGQSANPQTYSNSNVFIDTANTLNCATPATSLDPTTAANKTKTVTVDFVCGMIDSLCTQLNTQTTAWSS